VPLKRAEEGERIDKYSIQESEGDKIAQKEEQKDKDCKTAERQEKTKPFSEGSDG